MKTQEALSLLIAMEERVARVYCHFFQTFSEDPVAGRCWWEMAQDEYGHAGILRMVRELVSPEAEAGEVGSRLWSLAESVEYCEAEARSVASLDRAVELAIRLESSELEGLAHRVIESVQVHLPEGAARPFLTSEGHCRPLAGAVGQVRDRAVRRRLEAFLAGARVR